jgi:hypothetical protein
MHSYQRNAIINVGVAITRDRRHQQMELGIFTPGENVKNTNFFLTINVQQYLSSFNLIPVYFTKLKMSK